MSWFTLRVANVGLKLMVDAWNNHRIPGRVFISSCDLNPIYSLFMIISARRGIPHELMRRDNRTVAIDPHVLPEPYDAVSQFEGCGGLYSNFGNDPLASRSDLVSCRESTFKERYPNFEPFFNNTVNGNKLERRSCTWLCAIVQQVIVSLLP